MFTRVVDFIRIDFVAYIRPIFHDESNEEKKIVPIFDRDWYKFQRDPETFLECSIPFTSNADIRVCKFPQIIHIRYYSEIVLFHCGYLLN